MNPSVNASVNVSTLIEALKVTAATTTRDMRQVIANTGVNLVAGSPRDGIVGAIKRTPYVEIETIDAELEAVDHVSGPRGKWGKSVGLGGLTWTHGMMIAVMRTNPNSPYSISTDNRWPLAYAGGLRGAARWRFFADAAERMKASRHSSTHFLQKGWADVARRAIQRLRGIRSGNIIDVVAAVEDVGEQKGNAELGRVTETSSAHSYSITLANLIGTGMVYPHLSAERNHALLEHGTGPLQAAVDETAAALVSRYLPRLGARIKKQWSEFK